jgi:hypothetical protein
MFQTNTKKIKTHFMFSNFSQENGVVNEIMWKNIVETKQVTDDDTAHALCVLLN